MNGALLCLIGVLLVCCGWWFEQLPRGAVWFTLFRPKGETFPPKLVRRSKQWMIGTGLATILIVAVGIWRENYWLEFPLPLAVLLVGVTVLYVIWMKGAPKQLQMIVWPALAITLGWIGYLFVGGLGDAKVETGASGLEIRGMYSLEVPYAEIERVELSDQAPHTTLRTNGFALNGVRNGYFRLENGQACFLSIDAVVPLYIYIYRTNEGPVVVNRPDGVQTKQLFRELKNRIGQ